MTRLEGKVGRVRRRLALLEFSASAIRLLFYLSILAGVLVFAHRFFYLGRTNALIAGCLAALGAAGWVALSCRKINTGDAARRIDRKFNLQERVSTAQAMWGSPEPMLPALAADAEGHAEKIDPTQFRFRPPRLLCFLPIPLLALAVGLLAVPSMDILGRQQRRQQRQAEREQVKSRAKHIGIKARELNSRAQEKKLPEAKKLALKMQKLADDLAKSPKTKQHAMIKISKLADEARSRRDKFTRAEKLGRFNPGESDAIQSKIQKLGEAKQCMQKLAAALNDGKFGEAAEALEELAKKLNDGSIPTDEARKLGEALKELAANMPADDELTQALDRLAELLESLDLNDAQCMATAAGQMKLTKLEIEELLRLMEELKACDFAGDVLDYEQMCLSCGEPGKDGEQRRMGIVGLLGVGGAGPASQRGAIGGRGIGPRPRAGEQPVGFDQTGVKGKLGPGKILATRFVRGMPPDEAEAKSEYQEVLQSARKAAEDAISREDIPPESREKIKRYFDDLDKK